MAHLEQAAERAGGMLHGRDQPGRDVPHARASPRRRSPRPEGGSRPSPPTWRLALDVAELSLETGQLDEALEAFERIREMVDLPDHEVYALHGMIQVELRARQRRARARAGARGARDRHRRAHRGRAGAPGGRDRRRPAPDDARRVGSPIAAGRPPTRAGGRGRARAVAARAPAHARRGPAPAGGGPRWLRSPHPAARPPPSGGAAPPARRSSTTSASSATSHVCPECNHHFRLRAARAARPAPRRRQLRGAVSGDLEPIDALSFVGLQALPGADRRGPEEGGREVRRAVRHGHRRRPPARRGRHRLRLHRRQHGRRRGRGDHPRRRAGARDAASRCS